MVYSAVKERPARGQSPEQRAEAMVATRAVVSLDDRRYVLEGPRATIGRSKEVECVLARPQRLPPPRRAAPLADRRLDDRRPRLDQRRQGQRPARLLARGSAPATRSRSAPRPSCSTSSSERPAASGLRPDLRRLKFGFLAVLYLFLLWIARSALKDLRRTVSPAPDATGFHQVPGLSRAGQRHRRLAGRRARRRPRRRASAST